MPDRRHFCVIVLSLMILGSAFYLGYHAFIDEDKKTINKYNWIRMCSFFVQHIFALGMLIRLLMYDQSDDIIPWMFQLSSVILLTFIGGEVFVAARGGNIFGGSFFYYQSIQFQEEDTKSQFQVNQISLYYQITTDFIMFFIVSAIALIVIHYRAFEQERRYDFMIDNLKSEDYVDEPNSQEKKTCAICLTDLQNQRVLKVPCDHIFHKQCLVNWLKRSTICPLCRTDIEQSLDPNSPLRQRSDTSPRASFEPRQALPQINAPNRPSIYLGMQNQRVNLTDRVVEGLSNGNSRVLISRRQQQRNIFSRRERQELNRNNDIMSPLPIRNQNPINQQERSMSSRSQRPKIQIQPKPVHTFNQQPNSYHVSNVESIAPKSIYLPPPLSQNKIDPLINQTPSIRSQPFLKQPKYQEETKSQGFASSQQQIPSPNVRFYLNPNQKSFQNDSQHSRLKITKDIQHKNLNQIKINQIMKDQINV